MAADEKPDIEQDEPVALSHFHDVAQFARGGETRFYRLRTVANGAELWRFTEMRGERPESIREAHFKTSEEAAAFLQEMERALRAGGWCEL